MEIRLHIHSSTVQMTKLI